MSSSGAATSGPEGPPRRTVVIGGSPRGQAAAATGHRGPRARCRALCSRGPSIWRATRPATRRATPRRLDRRPGLENLLRGLGKRAGLFAACRDLGRGGIEPLTSYDPHRPGADSARSGPNSSHHAHATLRDCSCVTDHTSPDARRFFLYAERRIDRSRRRAGARRSARATRQRIPGAAGPATRTHPGPRSAMGLVRVVVAWPRCSTSTRRHRDRGHAGRRGRAGWPRLLLPWSRPAFRAARR